MTYHIKNDYRINETPQMYVDTVEDSRTYQVQVYEHVAELAEDPRVLRVLDIGCGAGTKLVEMVASHCEVVTGMDLPGTIEGCRERYPDHEWFSGDLEAPDVRAPRTYDLIVSADVIEHLVDPDRLLEYIRTACHSGTRVVLSTPERDLRRGPGDMGPPANPAHVREWNGAEFLAYLTSRGFEVEEQRIVDLREGMHTCQLVTGRFREVTS